MGTDLVREAELIVSSARLKELRDCSTLLRRTKLRAKEIVDHAHALHAEAVAAGDSARATIRAAQLREAHLAYDRVVSAYAVLCRRIDDERRAITNPAHGRPDDLLSRRA